MKHQQIFLTDELERKLVLAAMEEQFRPRPLLALAALFKRAVAVLTRSRAQRTERFDAQTA